jgi:hypothetical protein
MSLRREIPSNPHDAPIVPAGEARTGRNRLMLPSNLRLIAQMTGTEAPNA